MKAIETKYVGPGNVRGSRIIATDSDGNRAIIPYPHELNTEQAHAAAALALCGKMKWRGTLNAGSTRRGYVFTFVNEHSQYPIMA